MGKITPYICTAVGWLILLGTITLSNPVLATADDDDDDDDVENVKVVNKPIVKAKQFGSWDVKVNNSPDMPVPVVMKTLSKEAWTASASFTFEPDEVVGCTEEFYTVPEGKLLHIQYASGFSPDPEQVFQGDRYAAYLQITFNGTTVGSGPNPKAIHFDVSFPSPSSQLVRFGQSVDILAGAGSNIMFCVRRSREDILPPEMFVGVLNGSLNGG